MIFVIASPSPGKNPTYTPPEGSFRAVFLCVPLIGVDRDTYGAQVLVIGEIELEVYQLLTRLICSRLEVKHWIGFLPLL